MELGFDTVGNATIVCYDREPVLVTDPWIEGGAYFGSWTMAHVIPEQQMAALRACKYVWFSHGHPDHLNVESLPFFKDKKILLPDHVGKRVYNDLKREEYDVEIMEDRKWYQISERVRVLSIADYNQDAILLIDVGGRLVVNLNDASNFGWGWFVKKIIKEFKVSFLLALETFGDGDMINLWDEQGNQIVPDAALKKPVGRKMSIRMEQYGTSYAVPFSSLHRYQRSDSVWANEYITTLEDYKIGFDSKRGEQTAAYIRYDCLTDTISELNPAESESVVYSPEHFGDNWNDTLDAEESSRVREYFASVEHLQSYLDFLTVRVGGRDLIIDFKTRGFDRGLIFEVPRQSLMTAVDYKIFDDLLIGNFMKTTFVGKWSNYSLYPDFSPYVAKYSDNGQARTSAELKQYFKAYKERAPKDFLHQRVSTVLHKVFEENAINLFRSFAPVDSEVYQRAKQLYRSFKRPRLV
jgi:hypothetical protein